MWRGSPAHLILLAKSSVPEFCRRIRCRQSGEVRGYGHLTDFASSIKSDDQLLVERCAGRASTLLKRDARRKRAESVRRAHAERVRATA